jgi:hypothetical protein
MGNRDNIFGKGNKATVSQCRGIYNNWGIEEEDRKHKAIDDRSMGSMTTISMMGRKILFLLSMPRVIQLCFFLVFRKRVQLLFLQLELYVWLQFIALPNS